ncbi:condensation domain-containing protein [Kibdelosporangium persicum]|uniref:Carrier domain-containing protein n=1 Tax=Kibdelosporangium persicum TaxID=2698649 RepID=A0ABX2FHW8_9PSEU|nr:condensation domain-containing protein [Kibdelosporangium persicum]NRN70986.1 hypothetical protein [Kibdelosporangium persicum]
MLPITESQQGLLLVDRLVPEHRIYNEVVRFDVPPDLPVDDVRRALAVLVTIQPAMRQVFARLPETHAVLAPPPAEVPVRIGAGVEELCRDAFDLHTGPAYRFGYTNDGDSAGILLCCHHIVSDGVSLSPMAKDLRAILAGDLTDIDAVRIARETALARELKAQNRVKDTAAERTTAWAAHLRDVPPLELAPRPNRPVETDFVAVRQSWTLTAAETTLLQETCRRFEVTPFVLLTAVYGAVLARHSGASRVLIGSPFVSRRTVGAYDLVGFFVNTLPVTVDVEWDRTVGEHVGKTVREAVEHCRANVDLSFNRLVAEAGRDRVGNRNPLFSAMLAMQDTVDDPGVRELGNGTVKFDVRLGVTLVGGRWRLDLDHDQQLITPAAANALMTSLRTAVQQATAEGERTLADLFEDAAPIAGPQRLPAKATLTDWVDEAPLDAVAVEEPGCELTYRQLSDAAWQAAAGLARYGVATGDVVGLATDTLSDTAVAMLAILRCGATFLPLDRTLPAARLTTLVGLARCRIAAGQGIDLPGVRVIGLHGLLAAGRGATAPGGDPRSAPYLMFTSGSTGVPKGVLMGHGPLLNRTAWQIDAFDLRPGTRFLQYAPLGFDVSFNEIMPTLAAGGTLVAREPADRRDFPAIVDRVASARLTNVYLPVAALRPFVHAAGATQFPALRKVCVSGEQLLIDDEIRAFFARHPQCTLINSYGPTETNGAIAHQLSGNPFDWPDHVPIGRPLPGVLAYVVDQTGHLAPPGVPGELFLGGCCPADGYTGDAERTAASFLPDRFAGSGRMYRTGDQVVQAGDGTLTYLGRLDTQIKIRGHRVELGEIESIVPGVAVAHNGGLVLFVGTGTEVDLTLLRERLPGYMVPSRVHQIDEIPMSRTGKVDRAALGALAGELEPAGITGRAARTAQEQVLCDMFAEVLGRAEVGVEESFFALGGHSLLATRLISRIRAVMGVELPIRTLFDNPTVAGLAPHLDPQRRRPMLRRTARPDAIPVSYAQRRLWFLDKLDGRSATYNLHVALRLSGRLDVPALRAALNDVVARHEALRTVFTEVDGQPRQTVLSSFGVPLVTEAPGLAQAGDYEFDLSAELPIRAWLHSVADTESVLVIVIHHIAGDGWSMAPLRQDLFDAYAARTAGNPPEWTELPVQYADYTLWQRELLGAEDDPESLISRQFDYWREALDGIPDEIDLPRDRPRPAVASHRGDRVRFELDADLRHDVARLAAQTGTTVFMVMQAALAALIHRAGGGTDIPIGTPVAGRTDEALDGLVGFFVNTLVLRTDVSGDPTFRDLLTRVRDTDLAAYARQDVPFERLVEGINPPRRLGRHPLFQVMLSVTSTAASYPEVPGLSVTAEPFDRPVAKFDLSMYLTERGPDGITGMIDYATDLFDRSTIRRIAAGFTRLLRHVTGSPDTPVSDADLLGDTRRHQIVVEWNDTVTTVATETLPELIAAQTRRTPDAAAVRHGTDSLSYAELDERSTRLAKALVRRGAGPERFVGVMMPPSVDLVVALIAVLKAGGAYIPIDPGYPAERIEYMLADARPVLVLTDTDLTGDATLPALSMNNAAYVIYTSGSTGRPKGVVVEHRSLADYLAFAGTAYPGLRGDVLVHSSVSFDLTVTGMFVPLTVGGTVVLAALDESSPPCTAMKATPSHLPLLDARSSPSAELILGGEALVGEALAGWRAAHPDVTVINAYGPTETTVNCTQHRIGPGTPVPPGPVPIGKPMANTRVYVLDARLRPVDVGCPGELYVGGAGLARGYLNQPALTAQRFVADPFQPGARMYRTGDVVRWTEAGDLVFLGRADDQVKLRGFRIEPREVEAVLRAHPDVHQAVVVVRDDRLVGYVVARDVSPVSLRAFARQRLPEHMVPVSVMVLETLPLTRNGKLDRNALPAPEYSSTAGRPARTPDEAVLCGLYAEVLGRDTVGIDDNFFELGGHSLLATTLVSRVRALFGTELPLRAVFETPTVAELVERLDKGSNRNAYATLLPLRATGTRPPLFCMHAASGFSWPYAVLLTHLDMPVYGVQATAGPRPSSLDEMAEDYVQHITSVQPEGPYYLLGWSFGGIVAHTVATVLERRGHQVGLLVMLDSHPVRSATPDLAGLLKHVDPANLTAAEMELLLDNVMHHHDIAADLRLGRVSADVLVLVAGGSRLTAEQWRPYVDGDVDFVPTGIRHHDMLRPDTMPRIGPILAERLAKAISREG